MFRWRDGDLQPLAPPPGVDSAIATARYADTLGRIWLVLDDGNLVNAEVKARLEESASHPRLTRREVEVLELVSRGLRNKEIASTLGMTRETVVVHIRNIFSKFNVSDRTAAVRVAVQRGIIHMG